MEQDEFSLKRQEIIEEYDKNVYSKKLTISILIYFTMFYVITLPVNEILKVLYSLIYNIDLKTITEALSSTLEEPLTMHIKTFILGHTNIIVYLLCTIIVCTILFKYLKKDFINFKNNISKNTGLVVLGYFGILLGAFLSNLILIYVFKITEQSANQNSIETIANYSSYYMILIFVMTVILAPVIEEIIFRKSLFEILKVKSDKIRVIISALIFASIHVVLAVLVEAAAYAEGSSEFYNVITSALQIIPYFSMGLVISYIYYKSDRNVVTCIILHLVQNFIVMLTIMF